MADYPRMKSGGVERDIFDDDLALSPAVATKPPSGELPRRVASALSTLQHWRRRATFPPTPPQPAAFNAGP